MESKVKKLQTNTTYSTAIANCFNADEGGMGSLVTDDGVMRYLVPADKPSTK